MLNGDGRSSFISTIPRDGIKVITVEQRPLRLDSLKGFSKKFDSLKFFIENYHN